MLERSKLPVAVEAARGAGAILRAAFGRSTHIDYKSADQPVTQADRDADAFLREALSAGGEYGWISEESPPENTGADCSWIVDPLDGTVNFVEGRPEFAVCIGLIRHGIPELGVVYAPMTDEMYTAERGGVSTLNGTEIRAAPWSEPARLVLSWGEVKRLTSSGTDGWQVSTVGSTALKLMHVARGAADAYVSRSPKKIWDLCAPAVIAEVAGATVLDGQARPIVYSGLHVEVRGTVAFGPGGGESISRMLKLGAS